MTCTPAVGARGTGTVSTTGGVTDAGAVTGENVRTLGDDARGAGMTAGGGAGVRTFSWGSKSWVGAEAASVVGIVKRVLAEAAGRDVASPGSRRK